MNCELEERYGLKADRRDIESLLMYFQALMIRQQNRPEHKLRCLVSCFEGIGLAAYLQSRLNREFHELDVVEATAVYKIKQSYLDSLNIDLVLSTYPLNDVTTPVINLTLPINSDELKKEIHKELEVLHVRKEDSPPDIDSENNRIRIDFATVMGFIERFQFVHCPDSEDLDAVYKCLSSNLAVNRRLQKQLIKDLNDREALGALYFEEFNTRVIHCKSSAVSKPVAGILSFDNNPDLRMLFLVAPSPCSDPERRILSEITISFMENKEFRSSVRKGEMSMVRRVLMDIYKEFI